MQEPQHYILNPSFSKNNNTFFPFIPIGPAGPGFPGIPLPPPVPGSPCYKQLNEDLFIYLLIDYFNQGGK